jgi:lactate permease
MLSGGWTQVYYPWGQKLWPLSTLAAALPVMVLFGFLLRRKRPHAAAMWGALTAVVCAMAGFGMPVPLAAAAFGYGLGFAVVRICWIVLAAVFLYDIAVESGQFEILRASVGSISADRRLQALLIAFSFGAFIEGAAGFGSPVAIAAAVMVGLGFNPFYAAALCLIANTAPVAFGSIGVPIHTLALVSGLNESDLSAMNARILPLISPIVAFWLVRTMVGWKQTLEVLPAILVSGVGFGAAQFYWGNYRDSNLVDIVASLVSLVALALLLRVWKPKKAWRFPEERVEAAAAAGGSLECSAAGSRPADTPTGNRKLRTREHLKAWMPFGILTLFVIAWGMPQVKVPLDKYTTVLFNFPLLGNVFRDVPVVPARVAEKAPFQFAWLTATGTAAFLAAVASGLLLGLGPARIFRILGKTLYRMRYALVAILFMLGLAYVTHYSGMDAVMGLAFTRTGRLYPFFGAFLGWLGVALTGSDTSSNALFGSLQRITAEQLRLDPILMVSANSAGGVMGKMIAAQTIVVATAATNQVGREGDLFRFVFWSSIALGSLVGIIVMLYAYVFPQFVPQGLNFMK